MTQQQTHQQTQLWTSQSPGELVYKSSSRATLLQLQGLEVGTCVHPVLFPCRQRSDRAPMRGFQGVVLPCVWAGERVAVKRYARTGLLEFDMPREAHVLAAIGAHPNVVRLHGVVRTAQHWDLVLEWLEGRDLFEILDDVARPLRPNAASIAADLACALRHCHARGVMHRDIKPENILVTAKGRAVLLDFGMSSQAPTSTRNCGTPLYMAPEIYACQSYTTKADVWSFGVLLYEMLCGRHPWRGVTDACDYQGLCGIVGRQEIEYAPDMGMTLRAFLQSILQANPDQRPTMADLVRGLGERA